MDLLTYLLWLLGAYLVGSVPFGLLLGKLKGIDLREHGSGNVGATNAGRVLGKKLGLLCFGLDVGKGFFPVAGAGVVLYDVFYVWCVEIDEDGQAVAASGDLTESPTLIALMWISVAAAAVVGHVFPVWLKFKGGKGVATSLGVLLGVFPYLTIPALLGFVVWCIAVKVGGYVGLASVIAAALLPVMTVGSGLAWGLDTGPTAVFTAVTALLALLVIIKHRGNLQRIRAGTEPKAGWAKKGDTHEEPAEPTG